VATGNQKSGLRGNWGWNLLILRNNLPWMVSQMIWLAW